MPVSCSLQPIAETLRHIAGVIASLRSVRFAPAARYWIQTVMISASLAANSSSTFFMYLSVSFWDESSPSLAISSGRPSFWAFLIASTASRRILRMLMRAVSASLLICLTSSLRRSSVSGGMFRRMCSPPEWLFRLRRSGSSPTVGSAPYVHRGR